MYVVSEKTKEYRRKRLVREQLQEGLRRGLLKPEQVGIKTTLPDAVEWGVEGDIEDDSMEMVVIEDAQESSYDVERFIMGLPEDEGRVLAVRTMGYAGKEAAYIAGFPSVWSYIRALRKLRERTKGAKELQN